MDLILNTETPLVSNKNIIKVIGVGGAGNNAVNHMHEKKIEGIDYVICNTDIQDLIHSKVPHKLQIGERLTDGLGAGSIPQSGKDAAEESEDAIREMIGEHTRMVIIAAGMGGGTGTGASPVVARIAQEMGKVVVAIVTTPFGFERQRIKEAIAGIEVLEQVADALLVINNQKLQRIYGDLSFPEACEKANDVLVMAAKSISEIVTRTASRNIDYADLERILRGSGMAVFGVGTAKGGENRIRDAIKEALFSPLLDNCDISGAKSLLVNIVMGTDMSLRERKMIGESMQRLAGRYDEMKFGTRVDADLEADEIVITIVATRFEKDEDTPPSVTEDVLYPPEDREEIQMQVEDTQQLIEQATQKRREKDLQRKRQLETKRAKDEQEALAREVRKIRPTVQPQETATVEEEKPRVDKIEQMKQKRTKRSNKSSNKVVQGFLDFFTGEDVKDDVDM